MHSNACALPDPLAYAPIKAILRELHDLVRQPEVNAEYLVWKHNSGKAITDSAVWFLGFSPEEQVSLAFVTHTGLYSQDSAGATYWVSNNRNRLLEVVQIVRAFFSHRLANEFKLRSGILALSYNLHCVKRFVADKASVLGAKLAALSLRVETPQILEKLFDSVEPDRASKLKARFEATKEQYPDESTLTVVYNRMNNYDAIEYGEPLTQLWEVIYRQANWLCSDGKPFGVIRAADSLRSSLTHE